MQFFKGKPLIIATKHKKEAVITPILESQLALRCRVEPTLDTDVFGTFSGEIERTLTPLEAAKAKCLLAIEHTGIPMAIASEGSFGPHPTHFFLPANTELVLLYDAQTQLEVWATEISTETNFQQAQVNSWDDLLLFAEKSLFPSHGLILKGRNKQQIIKDILSEEALKNAYLKLGGTEVWVETDMRAMYNPTRQKTIEKATLKLVEKLKSTCPQCQWPGFTISKVNKGLKCSECGSPTRSTLSYDYTCKKCGFTEIKMYPHAKENEDPMYCDRCNP